MKLHEAFLRPPTKANPVISAIAPATGSRSRTTLNNIVVLALGDNVAVPVRYNKPAAILQTESMNILLGYFDPADKTKHNKRTIADGEMFLTCGQTRGLRLSDDGSIEFVSMFVKDDGTIVTAPLMTYSKDNVLNIKMDQLIVDMFGANSGGNIAWTQDKALGFNTFKTNYKGNNKDLGPRYKHETKGTPAGVVTTFYQDLTPSPTSAVPAPSVESMSPLSLQIEVSPSNPLKLVLNALAASMFDITLSKKGDLVIKNNIVKASIKMTATGAIEIASTAGLGKITMSPTGDIAIKGKMAISIDGTGGVNVKGAGKSLMAELQKVLTNLSTHIHPTPMGPSGPPVTASGIATAATTIGVMIKGKA